MIWRKKKDLNQNLDGSILFDIFWRFVIFWCICGLLSNIWLNFLFHRWITKRRGCYVFQKGHWKKYRWTHDSPFLPDKRLDKAKQFIERSFVQSKKVAVVYQSLYHFYFLRLRRGSSISLIAMATEISIEQFDNTEISRYSPLHVCGQIDIKIYCQILTSKIWYKNFDGKFVCVWPPLSLNCSLFLTHT